MKTETPAAVSGGVFVGMLYISIFLEVSGYANMLQAGQLMSWSFVPLVLGLLGSVILWFRQRPVRSQIGPTFLGS